jgi:hypothetical protein
MAKSLAQLSGVISPIRILGVSYVNECDPLAQNCRNQVAQIFRDSHARHRTGGGRSATERGHVSALPLRDDDGYRSGVNQLRSDTGAKPYTS